MINKYWPNDKKVEWLNKHFESLSDHNWGRYWFYNVDSPPYQVRVAHLKEETQSTKKLNINYNKIEKYFKEVL